MILLLLECSEDALAEGVGRVREFQQHQCHKLDGEQFVVGEEVEQSAAIAIVLQTVWTGKLRRSGGPFEPESVGAPGSVRGGNGRAGRGVDDDVRAGELGLEIGREERAFSEFTKFHALGSDQSCPIGRGVW